MLSVSGGLYRLSLLSFQWAVHTLQPVVASYVESDVCMSEWRNSNSEHVISFHEHSRNRESEMIVKALHSYLTPEDEVQTDNDSDLNSSYFSDGYPAMPGWNSDYLEQ